MPTHPPRRTRLAHEAEVAGLRNLTVQGVNVVRLAGGAWAVGKGAAMANPIAQPACDAYRLPQ